MHFVSGEKSNDALSPDYTPSLFAHTQSPIKRKRARDMKRFERASETKQRRIENSERQDIAVLLLQLSDVGNGSEYCEPCMGTYTMTDLSMASLEEQKAEQQKLEVCMQKL